MRGENLCVALRDAAGGAGGVPDIGRDLGGVPSIIAALARIETCVPAPLDTPPPEQVTRPFALLSGQGVYLGPNQGFCCREFMLAPENPDSGGRLVVAFFPDACPQEQLLQRIRALGLLSFCAEGKGQAPAPTYYQDVLAVFNAVVSRREEPLPFPEAVAVHKRGGATWPKFANTNS